MSLTRPVWRPVCHSQSAFPAPLAFVTDTRMHARMRTHECAHANARTRERTHTQWRLPSRLQSGHPHAGFSRDLQITSLSVRVNCVPHAHMYIQLPLQALANIHTRTPTHLHARTHARARARTHARTHTHTHVTTQTCTHAHANMHICTYVCMHMTLMWFMGSNPSSGSRHHQ